MSEVLVRALNVRVWFPVRIGFLRRTYSKAVDGVTIELEKGRTLALVGESGSGKTTLGRAILRLVQLTDGRIIYNGTDITDLDESELRWFRREAQMIFQDPYSSLPPMMTVYRILEEPLIVHGVRDRSERLELIRRALEDVRLTPPEDFMAKYPHQLSGGQRQRVAIARALVLRPKLVVADEPVSMIDASSRAEILYLMRELQERYGMTVLYITHDIATAKYFSDQIAVMYCGKIVERGPAHEIVKSPLHPYTQALIDAVPEPDPSNRLRLRNVPSGEPPGSLNIPPGCRFHPRCPYSRSGVCDSVEPELLEVSSGHYVACHVISRR